MKILGVDRRSMMMVSHGSQEHVSHRVVLVQFNEDTPDVIAVEALIPEDYPGVNEDVARLGNPIYSVEGATLHFPGVKDALAARGLVYSSGSL